MKTIRQLNQQAGEWVAHNWLKFSEQILAGGRSPASLTQCLEDKTYVRCNLIPEFFYEEAVKENKRWWVSDRNYEVIKVVALDHAKSLLVHLGAEQYPLCLAHFTKKG